MRRSTLDDLCNEYAVVSLHMLVTNASRDAESKSYTITQLHYYHLIMNICTKQNKKNNNNTTSLSMKSSATALNKTEFSAKKI